ncbi:uncharacterized protein TRIADDRAFT_34267, partial [Trichoplax adhaerens]
KHGASLIKKSIDGGAPIHFAASRGATEVIGLLLDSANNKRRKDGLTALHIAASNGYPDVVEALIQHHAPVDARDFQYRTPLHLAASFGHTAVMIILMQSVSIEKSVCFQNIVDVVMYVRIQRLVVLHLTC